jgi:hypothetical protein
MKTSSEDDQRKLPYLTKEIMAIDDQLKKLESGDISNSSVSALERDEYSIPCPNYDDCKFIRVNLSILAI